MQEAQLDFYRRLAHGGVSMIVYPVKEPMGSDEEASQYAPLAEAMHEFQLKSKPSFFMMERSPQP